MNRLVKFAASVLPLVVVAPVFAGDYHKGLTLKCGQCHVMHYSQSHGYNANGTGFYSNPGPGGPFEELLRDEVNNLCLSCHDNSGFAPDVLGANSGISPSDVREAGYLNRLGVSGLAPTGHTLDDLSVAPGSNPAWKPENENGVGEGLNCVNCHHQHGNASGVTNGNAYRNLRTRVGNVTTGAPGYVTYAIGTNDLTKDVFERAALSYDESKVDFNEPDSTKSAIGAYCGGCHTNFHGSPGDPNTVGGVATGANFKEFLRHPTAGVNIGALGGGWSSQTLYNQHANKVKVMSASANWSPATGDATPTCVSCHKAHGNGNAFGLIYRSGTGTLTEDGDSGAIYGLENLCGQCHVQASVYDP